MVLQEGVHYHFTTREEFEKGIEGGKFLEHAYVHKNIYGTSIDAVKAVSSAGKCCVLDIDVQGARQVRKSGLPAIFVFIAPPSLDELEKRLRGRGTESEEQIETRLKNARLEMKSLENERSLYDFVLVNDDVDICLEKLKGVAEKALNGDTGPFDQPPLRNGVRAGMEDPPNSGGPMSSVMSLRGWISENDSLEPTENLGSMAKWAGKTAIVTDATSGHGSAITSALAANQVRVIALGTSKNELEEVQRSIVGKNGVPKNAILPVVCDLAKEKEIVALPKIIKSKWPECGIDILIHTASASSIPANGSSTSNSMLMGSTSSWVAYAGIDILGTAIATREAVKDMKRRNQWGHILYIVPRVSESSLGIRHVASDVISSMAKAVRLESQKDGFDLRVSCIEMEPVSEPFSEDEWASDICQAAISCLSHSFESKSYLSKVVLTPKTR